MEGIIYLMLFFCAVAFSIVVVYISIVLKRVSDMMESMSMTLAEIEKKTHDITPEIKQSLRETGKLVDDLEHKSRATDDVVQTIENTGTSVQLVNEMAKQVLKTSTDTLKNKAYFIKEGLPWGIGVFQLYSKWKEATDSSTNKSGDEDADVNVIETKGDENE